MKKLLQSLFLLLFVAAQAMAQVTQDRTVTGKVTAMEDGLPLPGVSVKVAGTKFGTTTGTDGDFTLNIPAGTTSLVFTYIGYASQTVAFRSGSTLNIVMVLDSKQLGEVVVTALGLERQKSEVGYAATTLTNKSIVQAAPVNVANGLQGKVSGLNITSLNSGVFESVKINLRGIRSLTGNNNPLLLLDGVPADISYLSSINPNDVENVTVLKGASGAALYGPDARNGVIVLTTRKGSKGDKPVIAFSHATQLQQISFFPKFQTKFGSGGYGEYTSYENWSYGPAFDGSQVQLGQVLPDGSVQKVAYSSTNERQDFFNTGVTMQNSISFAAKDFFISVQDANIGGIVPDDKNRRTGIRMNTSKEYGKFKANFNSNYIQQNYSVFDDGAMENYQIAAGVGNNEGLMNLIFNTPGQIPITKYKDFKNDPYAQYNTYFNDYGINPYFALDNWRKEGKAEDLLTNIDLNLKATDWLSFTYRAGLTSKSVNERYSSKGEFPTQFGLDRGFSLIQGAIEERSYKNTRLSSEAFANFTRNINDDFKLNAVLGTYLRQNDVRDTRVGAANLVVTELFNVGNRTGELSGASPRSRSRLFSIYGSAGVGYKGWANLEVTGRQDKTSLLGLNNNTFFYPGVSGSLVLTEAIGALKNKNTVSYLKLRGAWNKTGNADIDPYLLAATFSQPAGFPFGSLPGYTANNTTYDANLEPEFIESLEAGVEAGFLDGRINLEATYFNQNNDNQIIPISVSSATGYTRANVNAASFINKGIELDLKLTPLVKLGGVNIEFRANATLSDSEIKSVYAGLDELAIGGFTTAANYAIKGYPAFVIKATDYLRDPQGRIIVNATTGFPTTDPITKQYGRTLPKWILGLNPSASWKGLSFSTLLEYKGGHYAYHGIGSDMAWTGVSAATAQNNRERFVMPNSSINTGTAEAPVYVANTNVAVGNTNDFFIGAFNNTATNFLTSAAAWRLREASLSFAVPQKFLARQGVVKGLNVAVTGRNLFLWVPKTNEFQDPDFNFTNENTSGISDSQINPPTRIFGGNVTITF